MGRGGEDPSSPGGSSPQPANTKAGQFNYTDGRPRQRGGAISPQPANRKAGQFNYTDARPRQRGRAKPAGCRAAQCSAAAEVRQLWRDIAGMDMPATATTKEAAGPLEPASPLSSHAPPDPEARRSMTGQHSQPRSMVMGVFRRPAPMSKIMDLDAHHGRTSSAGRAFAQNGASW